MPRLRKPVRVTKQVTAHTLPSDLSSFRSSHGTRLLRSKRAYSVRGSTAHQPTGSASRKATKPLVASAFGWPQSVCCRNRKASSSGPTDAHDSPGCILNLWHQHRAGSPRVPKTAWISSQAASLAGTIVSSAMRGSSVGDERVQVHPVQALAAAQERQLDDEARADHLAAELLDELRDRLDRAARREHVAVDHHPRALRDQVRVQLER